MIQTQMKLFFIGIILTIGNVVKGQQGEIIFANQRLLPMSQTCFVSDSRDYLVDTYKDIIAIQSDGCDDLFLLRAPNVRNTSLQVIGQIPPMFQGRQVLKYKFDNYGFLLSIQCNSLSSSNCIVFNQTMNGTMNWRSRSLTVDLSMDVFMDIDRNNQLYVLINLLWIFDYSGLVQSILDLHEYFKNGGLTLETLALTIDGNYILMVYNELDGYHLYFFNTQFFMITKIASEIPFEYKVWPQNGTAFYFAAWQDSSGVLLLYNYDETTKTWKRNTLRYLPSSNCYYFNIISAEKAWKYNLLASCVSKSGSTLSIMGYPPRSEAANEILLSNPTELWSIKNIVGGAFRPAVVLHDEYNSTQAIVQFETGNSTILDGHSFHANDEIWSFIKFSFTKEIVQPSTKAASSSPLPTSSSPLPSNPGSDAITMGKLTIFYIAIGFLSMCSICILAYYIRKRMKSAKNELYRRPESNFTELSTHVQTEMQSTVISNTQFSKNLQIFTLVSTQRELSVPGYLEVDAEKDIVLQGKIADGGSAAVFLGFIKNSSFLERCETNMCVAKVLNHGANEDELTAFRQEVAIMSFFQTNKDFAKIIGFSESPAVIYMNHYPLGSLAGWIHKARKPSPNDSRLILRFASNIINGINSMHENNFVHCDIKPANILIHNDPQYGVHAVITDFGIARVLNSSTMLVNAFQIANKDGWSVAYCPPEAFVSYFQPRNRAGKNCRESCECSQIALKSTDIYMFGMCLYEMLTRKTPFNHLNDAFKIMEAIWNGERPELNLDSAKNDTMLNGMVSIVRECWIQDPELRPNPNHLIQRLKHLKPARDNHTHPDQSEKIMLSISTSELL